MPEKTKTIKCSECGLRCSRDMAGSISPPKCMYHGDNQMVMHPNIHPCPHCGHPIDWDAYTHYAGDVICPNCGNCLSTKVTW